MKLPSDTSLPRNVDLSLIKLLRLIINQVNGLTEGRMYTLHTAMVAAPTTGDWAVGDFIRNSAPSRISLGGSGEGSGNWLLFGWVCTVAGTPGTWEACHFRMYS